MKPERVVCDTGPVLHLHEAEALDLLSRIESVSVPPAVEGELIRLAADWRTGRPDWLRVRELDARSAEQATQWTASGLLHKAESEALALALQLHAQWYLTDDTSARELARSVRVEAHGSLGVVLWAAAHGLLDRRQSAARLDALLASSLWVAPTIRQEARRALEQIFSPS